MDQLAALRMEIDAVDDQIVDLLGQRFEIARRVAAYKLQQGVAVYLPQRIEQVKSRCGDRGQRLGLRREFLAGLYSLIIEETCAAETTEQAALTGGAGGKT